MNKRSLVAIAIGVAGASLCDRLYDRQLRLDEVADKNGEDRWLRTYYNMTGTNKLIYDAGQTAVIGSTSWLASRAVMSIVPARLKQRLSPYNTWIKVALIAFDVMLLDAATSQDSELDGCFSHI